MSCSRQTARVVAAALAAVAPNVASAEKVVGIGEPNQTEITEPLAGSHILEEQTPEARRLKFHMLMHKSDVERAVGVYREVATEDLPQALRARLALADYELNRNEDAATRFRQLVGHPASPSLRWLRLQSIHEKTKGDMTFSGWIEILSKEPFWLPALYGKVAHSRGNWLSAATYGSTVLDLLDREDSLAIATMQAFPQQGERGDVDNSAAYAGKALDQFDAHASRPDWSWKVKHPQERAWIEAALMFHADRTPQATTLYEDIVAGETKRPSAFYRLARLYESQGRQADAEATIQAGLEKFPEKNSILLATAAEYAADKGNTKDAVQLLTRCLAASPEYPPAHILLAEIEARRGNRDAAIEACADIAAYCYGWGSDYIERINAVLETLVQQQQRKDE